MKNVLQITGFATVFLLIVIAATNDSIREIITNWEGSKEDTFGKINDENANIESPSTAPVKASAVSENTGSPQGEEIGMAQVQPPQEDFPTYNNPLGIFSLVYPAKMLSVSESEKQVVNFVGLDSSSYSYGNDLLSIAIQSDEEESIRSLLEVNSSTLVDFGGNKYIKYTQLEHIDYPGYHETYLLPIGTLGGHALYLNVFVGGFVPEYTSKIEQILGSIRVDYSKIALFQSQMNIGKDAKLKVSLHNIRAAAELYYDENGGYSNMCTSNSETIASLKKALLSQTSEEKTYCKASNSDYVYSVMLFSGGYYCVDSTGTAKTMGFVPGGLSCN